ncbi:MAG: ABC transporter permease [Gammaproteobacteria bacterium SG8_15]|nr:MAG: ABC transporter permease [Gammaproteobacteria bacterium SG8_15]
MSIRRFLAVLKARNYEFIRDKSALGWNFLFPILIVMGFAFAFSDNTLDTFKVGIYGDQDQATSEHPFFTSRHIKFVTVDDLKSSIVKVERHQLDMLFDLNQHRYWINNQSPNGYILERVLLGSQLINGEQPASSVADMVQFAKTQVSGKEIRYVDWLLPGVLAMNIMFSALFGVGYVIVRYRKNGVLKRLKATPLSAGEFLLAQVISRLGLVMVITIIVFIGTSLLLDVPMYGSYFNLLLIFVLGSISVISIGLLIAARTASEEFAGGILNLISWPMMFLSGVWFSLEGIHPWFQKLALIFPLTHLISGARAIMLDGAGFLEILPYLASLTIMSLVLLAIGALTFRWE